MKNEKNFKFEESSTSHYWVNVVDGIITGISYFYSSSSMSHSCTYHPNNDLSKFIYYLNKIVNIWKEKEPNTHKEFMNSLCDLEKEKYFGKNSKPPVHFSSSGYYPGYREATITITIFNSKIFSIKMSGSACSDTILNDSLDKRISNVCEYLHDFVYYLLEYHNIDYYYEFLDSLNDKEKEKYFRPSYLPKNYK